MNRLGDAARPGDAARRDRDGDVAGGGGPAGGLPRRLRLDRLDSPLGGLLVVCDDAGRLRALDFDDYEPRMRRLLRRFCGEAPLEDGAAPAAVRSALRAYFDGALAATDALAVATGGTAFQRSVWAALRGIAPGATTHYGALAARLGNPNASRAVGLANGANPIAIVVPCHRVVGAAGALTGYAGGLARKRWLLAHEVRHAPTLAPPLVPTLAPSLAPEPAIRQAPGDGDRKAAAGRTAA